MSQSPRIPGGLYKEATYLTSPERNDKTVAYPDLSAAAAAAEEATAQATASATSSREQEQQRGPNTMAKPLTKDQVHQRLWTSLDTFTNLISILKDSTGYPTWHSNLKIALSAANILQLYLHDEASPAYAADNILPIVHRIAYDPKPMAESPASGRPHTHTSFHDVKLRPEALHRAGQPHFVQHDE